MEHYIRLHPEPFIKTKEGKKTIESRLNDEKRQTFKVGDTLIFTNRADNTEIKTVITHLYYHKTFLELFSVHDPKKFNGNNATELIEEIEIYYTKEEQGKYGVVGIEFRLMYNKFICLKNQI